MQPNSRLAVRSSIRTLGPFAQEPGNPSCSEQPAADSRAGYDLTLTPLLLRYRHIGLPHGPGPHAPAGLDSAGGERPTWAAGVREHARVAMAARCWDVQRLSTLHRAFVATWERSSKPPAAPRSPHPALLLHDAGHAPGGTAVSRHVHTGNGLPAATPSISFGSDG